VEHRTNSKTGRQKPRSTAFIFLTPGWRHLRGAALLDRMHDKECVIVLTHYWTTRVNLAACVRVVDPEVKFPVTVTEYIPACGLVPPPPPELPPQEVSVIPRVTSAANATTRVQTRLCSRRRSNDATTIKRNKPVHTKIIGVCRYIGLLGQPLSNGKTHPRATVVTVTVAVCAAAPLSAIVLGDTAQVDPAGPPLQLNATLCANPPAGATAIE
jgi:hypothetical protein